MNTNTDDSAQMQQRSDNSGNFIPEVESINGKFVFVWKGSMTGSQSKVAVLEDFARQNPGSKVTVIFTSGGGGVDDCRESYNRMLMMRQFFNMHFTFVVLEAKSCAFWFIQCADVRIGLPHSAFMYHCVKWELSGAKSQRELEDCRKSMERNQKEFTSILCSRCSDKEKIIAETLELITDDQDHFFSSQEAVERGWLDQVYKPEFKAVEGPVDLAGVDLQQAN